MKNNELIKKHGIIISCQALEDEPLHGSEIMAKMAFAAQVGGAHGIRANTYKDIIEIKKHVNLPIIGIVKKVYPDSPIYITPTLKEVKEVFESGADIVAVDATLRERPFKETLDSFIQKIKASFPTLKIMADISSYEEGMHAYELGVDIISTTLSGYTEETKNVKLPNIKLVKSLAKKIDIPIIAEGGIRCPKDLVKAFKAGAYSAVIGSAITRPHLITKSFVEAVKNV